MATSNRTLAITFALECAALLAVCLWADARWLLPACACVALFAGVAARLIHWTILATLGLLFWWLWPSITGAVLAPPELIPAFPVTALLFGAAIAFLNILNADSASPVHRALGRFAAVLHFISAGILFAALYFRTPWHLWLANALAGLTALLVADCLGGLFSRLYTPRRLWHTLPEAGAFFFYRWLGPDWRATLPARESREFAFDLKLAEMWMMPAVRRALPPWLLVTLALAWLGSAIHQIPAGWQGVRQQLGAWTGPSLEPGLRFSLPWPLGGIQQVDCSSLREIVLGFQSDPGQPILWERAHYIEERNSLVGGGDDLLSISVPVLYRVADPAKMLRASSDPEALIKNLAQRALLRLTIQRTAADIMTAAREELRHKLRGLLQHDLDAAESGLAVAEVYLRDIHPPVNVAPFFQEVVSALENREAAIHDGESYERDNLERARGDAAATLTTATGGAEKRLLQAQGQALRFASLSAAWAQAPQLYQWREGFRMLDEHLAGAKKAIFDEAMRGDLPAHVDLRKVLNPDFVDSAPPKPQTLVPKPAVSRDAFDLDIEGFLRANQGEIPAPSHAPVDPDNLLKPQGPPAQ